MNAPGRLRPGNALDAYSQLVLAGDDIITTIGFLDNSAR